MQRHSIGLIILVVTIIVSIIVIKYRSEPFANYDKGDLEKNISFCPFGSEAHVFNGDTICCDGDFSEKLGCIKKTVCSLSSDTPSIPSCGRIYKKKMMAEAGRFCPKTKPHYYEKRANERVAGGANAFCFADPINVSEWKPASPTQAVCPVYRNEKDYSDPNSCYNQRQLDNLPCFTPELCDKGIIPGAGVIRQTFMGSIKMPDGSMMKMPRTCFYDDSLIAYYDRAVPDWKKRFNIDPSSAGFFCSTAKKAYVDLSISPQTLKFQ